jgi:hypothetical protein
MLGWWQGPARPPRQHITDAAVPGADLAASWQAASADYREALAELCDGRIIAAGVPGDGDEDDGPQLDIPPPCTFCDYQTLCGAGARA